MQMKIVVDTPQDYKKWLAEKPTLAAEIKAANAPAEPLPTDANSVDTAKVKETKMIAQIVKK